MRAAVWVVCPGDAHSNPHIDNCRGCAPRWGRFPGCPDCGDRVKESSAIRAGRCVNPECTCFREVFEVDVTTDPGS